MRKCQVFFANYFLSFSVLRFDEGIINATLLEEVKSTINEWCNTEDTVPTDDSVYEAYEVGPKIKKLFEERTDFSIRHLIVVKAPVNSGTSRPFPAGEKPKNRYICNYGK